MPGFRKSFNEHQNLVAIIEMKNFTSDYIYKYRACLDIEILVVYAAWIAFSSAFDWSTVINPAVIVLILPSSLLKFNQDKCKDHEYDMKY